MIGCKDPEKSEMEKIWDERIEREDEYRDNNPPGNYIDYNDNIENELIGTEAELLRMNKVNDSLLNELYKCKNQ